MLKDIITQQEEIPFDYEGDKELLKHLKNYPFIYPNDSIKFIIFYY